MLSDPLLVGIAHGIVFAVGYFVAKKTLLMTVPDGAATLRLVSGFTLGLLLGWLAGGLTAMLAYTLLSPVLQYSVSADSLFIPLIGKSFWFAAIGAGYTAWSIRKQTASAVVKAGRVGKEGSKPGLADNNSYAEAMAEVDEGRIDKGTWARAYAGSGGDESKAKAAYIKSRAVSIHSAAEWSNTLPSDDTQGGRAESPVSNTKAAKAGNSLLTTVWLVGGVAGAGIFAVVAISAYQDYSKRRVLAATPVQAPAPDGIQFGANDKPVPTAQTEPQSAIDRFLADAPAPNAQTATDWSKGSITPPPVKDQFGGTLVNENASNKKLLEDQNFLRAQGVGGKQNIGDVVAWGDAQLSARAINEAKRQMAHRFAIQWQYQFEMKIGESPTRALFLGYSAILNFFKEHRLICRPDAARNDGGVSNKGDGTSTVSPECF